MAPLHSTASPEPIGQCYRFWPLRCRANAALQWVYTVQGSFGSLSVAGGLLSDLSARFGCTSDSRPCSRSAKGCRPVVSPAQRQPVPQSYHVARIPIAMVYPDDILGNLVNEVFSEEYESGHDGSSLTSALSPFGHHCAGRASRPHRDSAGAQRVPESTQGRVRRRARRGSAVGPDPRLHGLQPKPQGRLLPPHVL
jgi:hypothetical protein